MNRGNAFLMLLLMLAGLLSLLFMMGVAIYSQRPQQEKAGAVTDEKPFKADVEELRKTHESLQTELSDTKQKSQQLVEENQRLKTATEQFDNEKAVILDQVKDSVSGFAEYKQKSTEDIAKLDEHVKTLEAEKSDLEGKVHSLSSESETNNQLLLRQIQELNSRIDSDKSEITRLEETVQRKETSEVVGEAAKQHYNMGNFYFRKQDYGNAAAEYRKSLSLRPDDRDAHFNLAVVCDEHLNLRTEAIQHYKAYLALHPQDERALDIENRILDLELKDAALAGSTLAKQ